METQKRKKKVLVLGFSVTAENNGYVEIANARQARGFEDIELTKIGLGGCQPYHLPPLLDFFLDDNQPSDVVFELTTPAFRTLVSSQEVYRKTISSLLSQCNRRQVTCRFLDLPRVDVDSATDWATLLNQEFCQKFGLPYKRVILEDRRFFRDLVHPTQEGHERIADGLVELLCQPPQVPPAIAIDMWQSCIPASKFNASPQGRVLRRAGLQMPFVEIVAGQPLTLTMPEGTHVTGAMTITGPKAGIVIFRAAEGEERRAQIYGQFCYYERPFPILFNRIVTSEITVEQSSDIPDIELRKGDKYLGERRLLLSALFCAQPANLANAEVL
jgi:hypothetical protein